MTNHLKSVQQPDIPPLECPFANPQEPESALETYTHLNMTHNPPAYPLLQGSQSPLPPDGSLQGSEVLSPATDCFGTCAL